MKWISVNDRLPCEGQYVLTANDNGIYCVLQTYFKGVWYGYDGRTDYEVTYWMELPELPNRQPTVNDYANVDTNIQSDNRQVVNANFSKV